MLGKIWVGMIFVSILGAVISGKTELLPSAVSGGAAQSIELILSIGGMIMLWSGVMEIMKRSRLSDKLTSLLLPLIGKLFPSAVKNREVMSDISSNMTANLLGLGNAATPAGIRAAEGLHRLSGGDSASDDLCMLVVINTASLQLIPTTVAAIRAGLSSKNPFDILPAVWVASIISQTIGICSAKLLGRIYKRRRP